MGCVTRRRSYALHQVEPNDTGEGEIERTGRAKAADRATDDKSEESDERSENDLDETKRGTGTGKRACEQKRAARRAIGGALPVAGVRFSE